MKIRIIKEVSYVDSGNLCSEPCTLRIGEELEGKLVSEHPNVIMVNIVGRPLLLAEDEFIIKRPVSQIHPDEDK
jgi:hypothetical protein